MKRQTFTACTLTASLLALPVIATSGLSGGDFEIAWDSTDAGGGLSTGGDFTVSDTVGQHDTGAALTGGDFVLQDGFQAGAARFDIQGDIFLIR